MNNENDLILVDKYLLVVKRNLLIKDKDEIINNLYDEILYDLDGDYSDENVKKVLESFGNPALLAIKYHSSDKYLIGPQVYDLYLYSNKICLQISSIVFAVIKILSLGIDMYKNTLVLSAFISSTIVGYLWLVGEIFLWVTLTFAICQKTLTTDQFQEYLQKSLKWDITKLNLVEPANQIKKSDVIGSIILIPIMFLLLFYFRHYNITINNETFYILNQSILPQTFILFGTSCLISFCVQILLLIKGSWTSILVVLDLFSQLFGIVISYYLIVSLKMFGFLQVPVLSQYSDTIYFWITLSTIIIAIITIFKSLYKLYNIVNKKSTKK